MSETVQAWQCIGCGNLEAPQTCIGVCEYRKVELVYAFDHVKARAALDAATAERDDLAALLRRLVSITPREGRCEAVLRRFQTEARDALAQLAAAHASISMPR